MKLLADDEFRAWASGHGIQFDLSVQPASPLSYANRKPLVREWQPPPVPSDLEGFVSTALTGASAKGPFWLYRKGGGEWYEDDDSPLSDQNRNRIVGLLGIPNDFSGAIGLEESEWRDLLLLILAFYVFGWEVGGDLQIVPSDGRCILQTSHHGPLRVQFADEEHLRGFTKVMAEARFVLARRPT